MTQQLVCNYPIRITAFVFEMSETSAEFSIHNVPTLVLWNLSTLLYRNRCKIFSVHNRSQSFTLTGNSNNAVQAMVGSTGSSNFCQADYIIIPMATNVGRPATGPSANVDRICGGVLSADVTLQPTSVRS